MSEGRGRLYEKARRLFDALPSYEKQLIREKYGDRLVEWYLNRFVKIIRDEHNRCSRRKGK